ncbi:MAG: leucine--tRNA ligase [Bacteroidetes bacterium RIFOXYA12_FULL_35_11]|nr:MAG: leucine--tRNA ligase [Bacteroidetes bacterium GWF2_35_48]OFY79605.1 MAG: leucine--tRNA ligase [Bacteroidetes bacterium RIFOXYA12_FULL_35_11]HBX50556.1 leucine--tRNA ligase [Bacteroidales bacterium]
MDYEFQKIEEKWQKAWKEACLYKVDIDFSKPKYFVLDMFPYPSGAGLHVGHPLGYIASDIYSRYKRLKGFNVLHPMGYDAYGLPAEQYAIQTGQHPAITTEVNIKRYREQLDKIGFSFDWSREVRTCDPKYYKWTQWVFIQLFKHWYNKASQKAEAIENLISYFEKNGTNGIQAHCSEEIQFSAEEWKSKNEKEQQELLLNYRLAYLADTMVNWCPALGTVLANDEVKDGYSVRGGHPVMQKEMKQWSLRISAYAQRLLDGLDKINWSDSLKEIQKNWIGRSEGAEVLFDVSNSNHKLLIFTTRPDTIFGATYMVLAPEHELVNEITTGEYKNAVSNYIEETQKRTERERMADTKKVSGQFTGAFAFNPFTKQNIPIWISDYVLAGYGTGAIMAVPAHDSRDYAFAKHFNLPIVEVISGGDITNEAYDSKDGIVINSDFLNEMPAKEAILKINDEIEKCGIGKRKINYRLRDAIFSRQRYWGEPFPIYYKENLPYPLDEKKLPLELPEIDAYLPTEKGEPPLGRAKNWTTEEGYPLELSTMPGFAGSSAYYLRYMDPNNENTLVSKEANHYWKDVDLYIGGAEHATGHLIYSRFWNKFLFDLGIVCEDEPFKKLINQGMIQGRSSFVYRIKNTNKFVSLNKKEAFDTTEIHADINCVTNDILDIEAFKKSNPEYANAEFIFDEDDKYRCGWAVEKMSKSMYNVVNPDDVIVKYGADTLRMYEMFLGPLELSKPWDTNGIDGVHKFLKKLWRLFYSRESIIFTDEEPSADELKILHKTIKKIQEDIENFSFNTSVSAFMICVNELTDLGCHKRKILESLLIILSPFAPHIAEELWSALGKKDSICKADFPEFNAEFLVENSFEYPVSFNGRLRYKLPLALDVPVKEIEEIVLKHESSQRWLEGKAPKKIIIVPNKIINVVV